MAEEINPAEPQTGFIRRNEFGGWLQGRICESAKWFLDFVRNVVVVAVLHAFAAKSAGWSVRILADLAALALSLYVVSYIQQWLILPFPSLMVSSRIWLVVGALIGGAMITGLVILAALSISTMVEQIAALQTAKP